MNLPWTCTTYIIERLPYGCSPPILKKTLNLINQLPPAFDGHFTGVHTNQPDLTIRLVECLTTYRDLLGSWYDHYIPANDSFDSTFFIYWNNKLLIIQLYSYLMLLLILANLIILCYFRQHQICK